MAEQDPLTQVAIANTQDLGFVDEAMAAELGVLTTEEAATMLAKQQDDAETWAEQTAEAEAEIDRPTRRPEAIAAQRADQAKRRDRLSRGAKGPGQGWGRAAYEPAYADINGRPLKSKSTRQLGGVALTDSKPTIF